MKVIERSRTYSTKGGGGRGGEGKEEEEEEEAKKNVFPSLVGKP
jgi:hypothetical protein